MKKDVKEVFKKVVKKTKEILKMDVKDILAKEKKDADTNLYYKALIKMREDAGLEFSDTKFAEAYKKHINQYK